ncbi:glycosyltransferase family 9 protein [Desulfothermus sp.]
MLLKRFSHEGFGRIYWLKKLDLLVGKKLLNTANIFKKTLLCYPSKDLNPRRFLIIRPGGIGDAVLLIPCLNLLKQTFPEAEFHILAENRNAEIFYLLPYTKVFFYHKINDLYRIFKGHYDVVIDSEQWHYLSAFVAALIKAKVKIGFATNERKDAFTYQIPYKQDEYEVFSFLNLIRPLTDIPKTEVIKSPFINLKGQFFLNLNPNYPWVAVFPGASIKERRWDKEKFRAVIRWLDKKGIKVIVIGGKQEESIGKYLVSSCLGHVNLAGKLSLKETAQVLLKVQLLLTADSGIMHLAVAVGTPVVALFGPGIEQKWAPRDGKSIVINKHLPCSPCTQFGYTPPCPYNTRCMKEITVDEVKEAINAILDKVNTP